MRSASRSRPVKRALFGIALLLLPIMLPAERALFQAAAQTADGAIIPLPESASPGESLLPDALNAAERFAQQRRAQAEQTPKPPAQSDSWISALRLQDIRHRVTDGITRITGEHEWLAFDVYASDTAPSALLRLTAVSSINNLPERSHMRVRLNGTDLGQRNLTHVETPGALDFSIPPDLLVNGRNEVKIEVRQHHRIFCGPEAAFDLWTDLDLSRSGLLVAHHAAASGIETFMMRLATQASGPRPVEIRGLDALGQDADAWRSFLVSRLNQVLSGAPVVFRFSDYWTTSDATSSQARITILPAASSQVRFVTAGDGAQVMVLELAPGTDPAQFFAGIPQIHERRDTTRAPLVTPGHHVPFAALGVETAQFSQHYASRDISFRLPNDWLVRTAAKARLHLDYAYAPNLPEGAMLLLSMNGTSIRLLPLRGEGGIPILAFPIDFEARLMHPGTNVLSMQMFVPGNPPDLPCPAVTVPMLQIGSGSSLHVPYSPSMMTPDMHMAFAALQPESLRRNELSARAFSEKDVLTLAAALSRSRSVEAPASLYLIAIDDLGSIPAAHYRIDRRLLERVVLSSTPESQPTAAAVPQTDDPFSFQRPQTRPSSAAFSNGWQELRDRLQWLRDRAFPDSGDQLSGWLEGQRGQAILFQLDPDRPDEIWMLRDPDSDIHQIAQALAAARGIGGGPRGQVAVLTHDGTWVNWLAPDRWPVMLEPWSMQNFRPALGNIVSSRPIFYAIMILSIALASAFIALRLVISTREHKV